MASAQDVLRRYARGYQPPPTTGDPALDRAVALYRHVPVSALRQLLDPTAPGGLRVRPTGKVDASIARGQPGRASVLGSSLPEPDSTLGYHSINPEMIERAGRTYQGHATVLMPAIRYWTAALCVYAWAYCNADARTLPRKGRQVRDGLGWWYGSSDCKRVWGEMPGLHEPMVQQGRRDALREACQAYRDLAGKPCACERQIAWAYHAIEAAQSRAA